MKSQYAEATAAATRGAACRYEPKPGAAPLLAATVAMGIIGNQVLEAAVMAAWAFDWPEAKWILLGCELSQPVWSEAREDFRFLKHLSQLRDEMDRI